MSAQPAETVRRALLAINRGDEAAFLESLHPDVVWHSHVDGLVPAAVWRGREGVREGRQAGGAGRDIRMVLHGIVTRGDRVLVLGVVTATAAHRGQASTPIHWLFTVRDGLALHVESFRSRAAAEAAFARDPC